MMVKKENWLHNILRDPECKGGIIAFTISFVLVVWGLAFFCYAMARLNATGFEPVRQLEQRMDRAEYEFQWLTNEVVSDHAESMAEIIDMPYLDLSSATTDVLFVGPSDNLASDDDDVIVSGMMEKHVNQMDVLTDLESLKIAALVIFTAIAGFVAWLLRKILQRLDCPSC